MEALRAANKQFSGKGEVPGSNGHALVVDRIGPATSAEIACGG